MRPDGRVTFLGHDAAGRRAGPRRARAACARRERLVEYVAALTRHHLGSGFLVHQRPLDRRAVWRYLRATAPYRPTSRCFTVADRLATRGRNAERGDRGAPRARARDARRRARLPRRAAEPLVRGDDLARELGIAPGPRLGELLAQLEEDRFAGEITTREEAIDPARRLASGDG